MIILATAKLCWHHEMIAQLTDQLCWHHEMHWHHAMHWHHEMLTLYHIVEAGVDDLHLTLTSAATKLHPYKTETSISHSTQPGPPSCTQGYLTEMSRGQ